MCRRTLRQRLRDFWDVRRWRWQRGCGRGPAPLDPEEPWEDRSLVPRRPRPPTLSGAVALELPPPEVRDVDALGRELDLGDEGALDAAA